MAAKKLPPWIARMICLNPSEVAEIEYQLNQPTERYPKMSEPRTAPELTPEEKEVIGLPAEPNVPPDSSYEFNAELNRPTDSEE